MERIKMLFLQSMMISFGILIGLSIQGIIYKSIGDTITLQWYHPLSIVVAGFLCSLPTLLLTSDEHIPKSKYHLRIIIHFIILFIVIMVFGRLVNWYTQLDGAISVAIEFVFIYNFVWVGNAWLGVKDQKKINQALDDIRDEE